MTRAAICQKCPMRRKPTEGCGNCQDTIRKLRSGLLGGHPSVEPELGYCAATEEDCATTIHLDLPPATKGELPPKCWRKAT